uniref:ATPase family protein n=1 Tax=Megaviridae environmental sample TaxID=1737588 RepID=A0A5J6VIY8_9VIRU|nr:MAG: ATPase family protein [Megaviridae environmental sample]
MTFLRERKSLISYANSENTSNILCDGESSSDYEPSDDSLTDINTCIIDNSLTDIDTSNTNHHETKYNIYHIQNEMHKEIKKRDDMITPTAILKLNVSMEDRIELYEQRQVLETIQENTNSYFEQKKKMRRLINEYNKSINHHEEERLLEVIKASPCGATIEDLKTCILKKPMDEKDKVILYNKYRFLLKMNPSDSEFHKLLQWLQIIIRIPFKETKQISCDNRSQFLKMIHERLDKEIYGMDGPKEEILMMINNQLLNPSELGRRNIGLDGQPGTGKTAFVRCLAKALEIPFQQISLGGVRDSSFLDGHSYTYEGAKPGLIVDTIIKMGCKSGIIFFDELDKISNTKEGHEVSNLLLHIIDRTQNNEFVDKYLPEFHIDLSNITFIFSVNDRMDVDFILRNRIHFVNVPGYTLADKFSIVKHYIMPRYERIACIKMPMKDCLISYFLSRCEEKYPEPGVRKLEDAMQRLIDKFSLSITMGDITGKFITKQMITSWV